MNEVYECRIVPDHHESGDDILRNKKNDCVRFVLDHLFDCLFEHGNDSNVCVVRKTSAEPAMLPTATRR